MSASMQARRSALAAAAVLPFLGACASLIGLEEATVEETSSSTESTGTETSGTLAGGTQSTGTDGTTQSTGTDVGSVSAQSASSGGGGGEGGGGDGGSGAGAPTSSTGDPSSTGSGGEGGSGGAGPVGDVVQLPGVDGKRLAVYGDSDAVFLLGQPRPGAQAEARCFENQPGGAGGGGRWFVWRVDTEECDALRRLDGDELQVTSLSVRYTSTGGDPRITLAGIHRGAATLDGNAIVADDGGTFALTVNSESGTALTASIPSGEDGKLATSVPVASWAFPVEPSAFSTDFGFGGTFEHADSVSCSGSNSVDAAVVSFLGRGNGADTCIDAAFGEPDGWRMIDGLPLANTTLEGAALYLKPGPDDGAPDELAIEVLGLSPPPALTVAAFPPGTTNEQARVSIRQIAAGDDTYFVIFGNGGVGSLAGLCVDDPPAGGGPKPFVAVVDGATSQLDCRASFRGGVASLYRRYVAGAGTADDMFIAAERDQLDNVWDLARITIDDEGSPSFEANFCTDCVIQDMASRGSDVWVLGVAVSDRATIMGNPLAANETFLFRVDVDDLP